MYLLPTWLIFLLFVGFSDRPDTNAHGFSQRHPSNWVDADEDDDDNGDDNELCIQSTPPYYEEQ
jgi:cell cycle checkpoint control protein RAD9A